MSRSHPTQFQATIQPQATEREQSLFADVFEAIGAGIGQIAHEIIPDVRAKLIDEGWFGRPAYPQHDLGMGQPAQFNEPLQIDGVWDAFPSASHDLDR